MWSTTARPILDALLKSLSDAAEDVPQRAAAFVAASKDVESQIRKYFSWWRTIGDDEVQRLRDRVRRLSEIGPDLAELFRSATKLESELAALESENCGGDTELADWFHRRRRERLAVVSRLGTKCEREEDVRADENRYSTLQSDSRADEEALELLQEAAKLSKELVSDIRAASLIASLPNMRARLLADGSSMMWLTEMRALVQPLITIRKRAPVVVPDDELEEILSKARAWSRQLGALRDKVEAIGVDDFNRASLTADQMREQEKQAADLLKELIDLAEARKKAKFDELEQQMKDLRAACGRQPNLDEGLASLRELLSDTPQNFDEWERHFGSVQRDLQGIAYNRRPEIIQRVQAEVAKLKARAEQVQSRPLSEDVGREVGVIIYDLDRVVPSQAEDALARLRRLGEIEVSIENLDVRVEREYRELQTQEEQLGERVRALRAEAARVRVTVDPLDDLAARIDALPEGSAQSLGDRTKLVQSLSTDLRALETQFVQRCRERVAREAAKGKRAADVLRMAGALANEQPPRALAADAQPQDAAHALLDMAKRIDELSRAAKSALAKQERRAGQLRKELEELSANDLPPDKRGRTEALTIALATAVDAQKQQLFDRLEAIAERVRDAAEFLEELHREERVAREQYERLHRRLREFQNDRLEGYCRELTERVTALLFGVPSDTREWAAVRHQLESAEKLFNDIERQAWRLAADDVVRAEQSLKDSLQGAAPASVRANAEKLLGELSACRDDALPPAALRLRLIDTAQQLD